MVREAEENAEADKKARELIDTRNSAEAQVHAVRQDLAEYGDKITEDEKTALETAVKDLETAMASEDVEAINTAQMAVYQAAQPLMEAAANKESTESKKDDVVDAEFTEVKN